MKIYFCGSIRGGRNDTELYRQIITYMQGFGEVLTEHVGNAAKLDSDIQNKNDKEIHDMDLAWLTSSDGDAVTDDKYIHDRDLEWLESTDVVVAECTQPSLGVGYEIGRAVAMKKKILCLFRPDSGKRLSAMIGGAVDGDNFTVKHYKDEEYKKILKDFFGKIEEKE